MFNHIGAFWPNVSFQLPFLKRNFKLAVTVVQAGMQIAASTQRTWREYNMLQI